MENKPDKCYNIHELVDKFYDYLISYTLKKTTNKSLAEDIVQEVMLKLVEAQEKKQKILNVKAWLFQVTRHTIADHFKAMSKETTKDGFSTDLSAETEPCNIRIADFVVPMIKLLPHEVAAPLMMSDVDQLPQKEIAKKIGLSISATKMRIQRARNKLRQLFVECCHIVYDNHNNIASCTIKDYCTPLLKIEKELHSSISK